MAQCHVLVAAAKWPGTGVVGLLVQGRSGLDSLIRKNCGKQKTDIVLLSVVVKNCDKKKTDIVFLPLAV